MSKLLIDERVVAVLPSLVRALGCMHSAAVLQQVHYRQNIGKPPPTKAELSDETGLTERKVRTAVAKLEKLGLLNSQQRRAGYDRTIWVSIDYEAFATWESERIAAIATNDANVIWHDSNKSPESPMEMTETSDGNDFSVISTSPTEIQEGRENPLVVSDETTEPEPAPKRRQYTEAFNAFWVDYGRFGVKTEAADEWKKLSPDDRRDAHRLLGLYFASMPGYQTTPKHAARYLKKRVWENFLDDDNNSIDVVKAAVPHAADTKMDQVEKANRRRAVIQAHLESKQKALNP